MDCRLVAEEELAEKYVSGKLDPALQDEFEIHILECTKCTALVEMLEEIRAALAIQQETGANPPEKWYRRLFPRTTSSPILLQLGSKDERTDKAVHQVPQHAGQTGSLAGEVGGILTCDPKMMALMEKLIRDAATDSAVLIQGERGTGKEILARAVHRHSKRRDDPFVVLHCPAIPASLTQSEVSDSVRTLFSGAMGSPDDVVGARGGTLLLNEVGELDLWTQACLLRVLQSPDFNRETGVRLISITNRDLEREAEQGHFSRDLYDHLSGIVLKVPPLRDRPDDIPLLSNHFLQVSAKRLGRTPRKLSDKASQILRACPFPGNIRELEAMMRLLARRPSKIIEPAELKVLFKSSWLSQAEAENRSTQNTERDT